MLGQLARILASGKALPAFNQSRGWIGDTVSVEEAVWMRRSRRYNAEDLIARCQGIIDFCVRTNAQQCTSTALRLYSTGRTAKARPLRRSQKSNLLNPSVVGMRSFQWADSAAEVVEVVDHPMLVLLRRPNDFITGVMYQQLGWMHRMLGGTSYEFVVGDREPQALLPLYPAWVDVQPDPTELIKGYWYRRNQQAEVFFTREEVDPYWFGPDLNQPYVGRGPLHGITQHADAASAIIEEAVARISNGARPDFAWVSTNEDGSFTAEQQKQAEQRINKYKGVKNAGKPLVVGNLKPVPLSWSYKDMEWEKLSDKVDKQIRNAFGIPESMADLNEANLASGRMGLRQYYETTIQPMLITHAEQLTERLLPRFGIEPGEMYFAYDNVSPEDEQRNSQVYATYISARVLTVNEVRAELGREPVEWGDKPAEPNAGLLGGPLAMAGAEAIEDEDEPTEAAQATPDEPDAEDEADTKAAPQPVTVKISGRWFAKCACGKEHRLIEKDMADLMGTPAYRALLASLKDWYAKVDPAIIAGANNQALIGLQTELAALMRPYIQEFFESGVLSMYAEAGAAAPPSLTASATAQLDQYLVTLSRELTETVRADVTDAIRAGIEQGQTVAETSRGIADALGEQAGWRSERVARTEVARAQEYGRLESMKDVGVSGKSWLLSNAPCQFCEAALAIVRANYPGGVPLNVPFLTRGSVLVGSAGGSMVVSRDVMVPTDLHPQCACALGGVFG